MRALFIGLLSIVLSGCGSAPNTPGNGRPDVRPTDFALVPCGPVHAERPCVLIIAGGKRVLLGAPAGVAETIVEEDLAQLDVVMIFSLHAEDIEGLDEVRNASWRAGRQAPLLVAGPEGTIAAVEALNRAFEVADALRVVEEGMPPGGYDAAVLTGQDLRGNDWQTAYDTGDLVVRARSHSAQRIMFEVQYRETVRISPCGGREDVTEVPETRGLTCEGADIAWPLAKTVFIRKSQ